VPGGDLLRGDLDMDGREFLAKVLTTENLILNVSATVLRRDDLAAVLQEQASALAGYTFAGDWHVYAHLLSRGGVSFAARPLNSHRRHAAGATISATASTHVTEIERVHTEVGHLVALDDATRTAQADYRRRVFDHMTSR
jgi:hypothetical protein